MKKNQLQIVQVLKFCCGTLFAIFLCVKSSLLADAPNILVSILKWSYSIVALFFSLALFVKVIRDLNIKETQKIQIEVEEPNSFRAGVIVVLGAIFCMFIWFILIFFLSLLTR